MTRVVSSLPTDGVTFLLTDIEGSTRAWQAAPHEMTAPVSRHYEILDAAIAAHHGQRPQEQGEGDSIVAVFRSATDGVAAALDAQLALRRELPNLPVRMALHSGDAMLRDEHNYVGLTIIRCARIRACGHGQQILLSDRTAMEVAGELPTGAGVADLGVYGLRDLAGRERIWQLTHPDLPATFPPLKAGASASGNLPAPISSFVGRGSELAELSHSIAQHRLVSLVGESGIGKSRLAIAAAGAAADSLPGGVWWVPMPATPDFEADALLGAITQACAIDRAEHDDPLTAVVAHFRAAADALLVIDDAEPASAMAVQQLLGQCPSVRVLATGRHALSIAGEVVHQVAPLLVAPADVTDASTLQQFDAMRLFLERAGAARGSANFSHDDLVAAAEVCRHVGGVPLALELAAARSASISLTELAAGLAALPAATGVGLAGTLASSIAWSYQLLDEQSQCVLRRLAIFVGAFEIDAATAVAADDLTEREVVTAVQGLVAQHLLTVDEQLGRLALPPSIRRFAHDRLVESADRGAVVRRHGSWFAAVAERFAATDDDMPVSLLAPDEPDVIAALAAAIADDEHTVAHRIIGSLGNRWSLADHEEMLTDAADWLTGRSPADGEEQWAAAVARLCAAFAERTDAGIHGLAEEARAVAEVVHDDTSARLLDDTIERLATHPLEAAGTVRLDMTATT